MKTLLPETSGVQTAKGLGNSPQNFYRLAAVLYFSTLLCILFGLRFHPSSEMTVFLLVGWLFGFNGPLRQCFSLYRAVSQRGRKRSEMIDESKNVQTTHPHLLQAQQTLALLLSNLGRPGTVTQHLRTTRPPLFFYSDHQGHI